MPKRALQDKQPTDWILNGFANHRLHLTTNNLTEMNDEILTRMSRPIAPCPDDRRCRLDRLDVKAGALRPIATSR
jgi:hypothetical protein